MYKHLGKVYTSKKHPILEFIFEKYFEPSENKENIVFYLSDIAEGYKACNIPEPVSISNTILDLCRQDRGIDSRIPKSISALGYDLKKKTGIGTNGKKYAGEFVYVGVGKTLNSWLKWSDSPEILTIDSSTLPKLVRKYIRPDEGGLFSVIDYLDILSKVVFSSDEQIIFRIQNPMKWQPNEIDGFYAYNDATETYVYPVEAKALTTQDAINLDQLAGGFRTTMEKMKKLNFDGHVQQIAVRMIKNGIDVAIFAPNLAPIEPDRHIRVKFTPEIENWN